MPHLHVKSNDAESGGCGTQCGNGLEKVYPTTAIRYGAMNWIGEFTRKPDQVFSCGGKVVIRTDRGTEIGEQVSMTCGGCDKSVSREQMKRYVDHCGPEFYKLSAGRIIRVATDDDLKRQESNQEHIREAIDECALLAAQLNLDMKVITAEHLLGDERLVFYFRAEHRVDFRELVRRLATHYKTRIELRQVGARDEARLVADYEVCGRECCCKNFLKKLRPVTMKMAKIQKSTLDPSKVSGRCGRLRCCLRYEHEGYQELMKKLPRVGSMVETEFGSGKVVDRQILTQLVLVRVEDREVTVPVEELGAKKPAPAAKPKPEREPDAPRDAKPNSETSEAPRRRRRRRGRNQEEAADQRAAAPERPLGDDVPESPAKPQAASADAEAEADTGSDKQRARRRRRRRSRSRDENAGDSSANRQTENKSDPPNGDSPAQPDDPDKNDAPRGERRSRRRRSGRRRRRGGSRDGDASTPENGGDSPSGDD